MNHSIVVILADWGIFPCFAFAFATITASIAVDLLAERLERDSILLNAFRKTFRVFSIVLQNMDDNYEQDSI
jgi:uncharacterized protein involved in cysteine biosynthesis